MNEIRAENTIIQEIVIKASAERIFAALTDHAQRMQWWGAEGRFQTTHMESDLRIDGKWMMRGTGMGQKLPGRRRVPKHRSPAPARFHVVARLVREREESVVRFELQEDGGFTKVRLTHSGLTSEAARAHRGWPDILDWPRTYLEGKR